MTGTLPTPMKTAEAEVKSDLPSQSGVFPTSFFIKRFGDITIKDIPTGGGKTASLGEMLRELAPQGVKVPDGFAITAEAYRHFLRKRGLDKRIDKLLEGGTERGTTLLEDGQVVTVSCASRSLRDSTVSGEQRIDSISLNPDTVLKTTLAILEKE